MLDADPSAYLPRVVLRDPHDEDTVLLRELSTPDVLGEWDSHDDAPDQKLSGTAYHGGTKIVELDDATPVGSVSWIQIPYGPNRLSPAWSIGVTILLRFRGHHFGAAAQRHLALELLARSGANRVQADTDVGNVAERQSLARARFTREGVARGAQWRNGRWHDRVVYGLLRGDH